LLLIDIGKIEKKAFAPKKLQKILGHFRNYFPICPDFM